MDPMSPNVARRFAAKTPKVDYPKQHAAVLDAAIAARAYLSGTLSGIEHAYDPPEPTVDVGMLRELGLEHRIPGPPEEYAEMMGKAQPLIDQAVSELTAALKQAREAEALLKRVASYMRVIKRVGV